MYRNRSIVFSAVQPSGILTIGNYLGSINNWVNIQNNYKCIYCIADLHALTKCQKNEKIYNLVLDTLSIYLSCGIDPKKSIVFVQSDVPEHNQLYWILNCYVNYGELIRMHQFKNKVKNSKKTNIGILNYPVLMASDILLYQTQIVPVGYDQKQHLELSRNIARRINNLYGNIFNIPILYPINIVSNIMSLSNPKVKMSKSDINVNSFISLLDSDDILIKKINLAITDSDNPPEIYYNKIKKPGISNLINIFSGITNMSISEIENHFLGQNYRFFKKNLFEVISDKLNKIQKEYKSFRKDESYLKHILKSGSEQARSMAQLTLKKIYFKLGLNS